jgi:hypothetical protein
MIFAYGSLVNPAARPKEVDAVPALLSGWSREWMHRISTPRGKVCALTVAPDADSCIKGVVLVEGGAESFEVDEREIGYQRIPVAVQTIGGLIESPVSCSLYVGAQANRGPATREYPIWRSYLDCVLSGYIRLGGPEAADDFVRSTRGWQAPFLDDRDSPKYPRAVYLTAKEKEVIDAILRRHLLLGEVFS